MYTKDKHVYDKTLEQLNNVLIGVNIDSMLFIMFFVNAICSEGYYKCRNIRRL